MKLKKGMTLIEIVTVAAIVSLLAMLALMVMVRVRRKARMTVCMSNLRKIGVAYQMYMDDYTGWSPLTGRESGGNGSNKHLWSSGVGPIELGLLYHRKYVKNLLVFYCPENEYFKPNNIYYGIQNYGVHNGYYCEGNYWARGPKAFYPSLPLSRHFKPESYPDRIAWISDYNIVGDYRTHREEGLNVLRDDGSVRWVPGPWTSTDSSFWDRMDVELNRP